MMGISYNKSILVGRLTADPQLTYSTNGTTITKVTLAVDRQFKRDDQAQPETDFIRVVAFGKTAEFATKYFHKGSLIMIEGRIQVSKYVDQNGNNRYSTDVIAENVRFMETKGNYSGKPNDSKPYETNRPQELPDNLPAEDGDEVPF
jgi:single-strand DNA-binding protein